MELVLMIGLPGSGKSTLYHSHLSSSHLLVSKDAMRGKRNRDHKQRVLLEQAEAAGRSVVLDNTHPSVESRRLWIGWGRDRGWRVTGYYLSSVAADCYERNALRTGDDKVPDVGFYAIVKQLQLPRYEEGFDALYYVSQADGKFQVQDWRQDEDELL